MLMVTFIKVWKFVIDEPESKLVLKVKAGKTGKSEIHNFDGAGVIQNAQYRWKV